MQECDKFRVHFSSYIEGELIAEERQALEAHLAVCSDCSEAIYQIKIIRRSLQTLPPITTSQSFEHRLQQRIADLNNASPWATPFMNLRHNWKIPAIGSAVASIVIVGVLLLSPAQQQASKNDGKHLPAAIHNPLTPTSSFSNMNAVSPQTVEQKEAMPVDSMVNRQAIPRTNRRPVQLVGD